MLGVAHLGVAGTTPASVEDLATSTGAHAPSLYRVMRMLASAVCLIEARMG